MKTKTWNILYWSVAFFFCGSMLLAGIVEVMQTEEGKEVMRHLGFPMHVLRVIGMGKILGSLALLQTRFRTLREWAYSGFTINLIGAFAARAAAHDSVGLVVSPLIGLVVVFLFYFLWKKKEQLTSRALPASPGHVLGHSASPAAANGLALA